MNINVAKIKSKYFLWSVAIFTAREQPSELFETIKATVKATNDHTIIDVMVNGNQSLAVSISDLIKLMHLPENSPLIRIWSIPLGGKAHAWNQYVHHVWPSANIAFFVDGYARAHPDAFKLLATGMSVTNDAIAGTGVPTSGKTAIQLREDTLRDGGLHGAFFAIKEETMVELRRKNIRLPLGLYGFDTLLGAVLAFGLDPMKNEWDVRKYIFVHPDVTWEIDEKKWWRYSVVRTQFKRIYNNALRKLVVGATKNHLAKRKWSPESIPRTIEDFVLLWANDNPNEVLQTFKKSPLSLIVLHKLRKPKDWSAAAIEPLLVYSTQ